MNSSTVQSPTTILTGQTHASELCGNLVDRIGFDDVRGLNFGHRVVNNGVQADVDALLFSQGGSLRLRPDIEPDNNGIRRGSQQHVGFRDPTDAAVNDAQLDRGGRKFFDACGQCFSRPLDVRLDYQCQFLDRPFLNLG